MSVGDVIQLIGISVSTIIGILSLIIGVNNYKNIKMIKHTVVRSKHVETSKARQKAKADHGSTAIQVGGDIK